MRALALRWLALAALALAGLAGCASLPEPGRYANPVLAQDFPDPAILRAPDGWFYAYATQATLDGRAVNIQVARSADLVRWDHLGDALPTKPAWASTTQKFWAPHALHAEGRYLLYYSAQPDHAKGLCLAVATSARPEGPFADSGRPMLCGEGIEHIDPMAFDDPKTGARLLYWGSGRQPIRVQALAPDRLGFAPGSESRELLGADGRPYRSLIEAAWVVHREGRYYLFYSGDRCCSREPRYAVLVARSDHATGPFEELPVPILEAGNGWIAPGHNGVVTDDAGTDWLLYHAMRAPPDRLLMLDRLEWRDGWPRIAGDAPSSGEQRAPALRKPRAASRGKLE